MDFVQVLLIVVLLLAAAFLLYRRSYSHARYLLQDVPGPKTLPILGNVLDFVLPHEEIFKKMCQLSSEFWPTCLIWFGPLPYVILNSPQDLEVILGSTKYIDKTVDYVYMEPWLGTGLLTSTGNKWHKHRRIITPAFHFRILDDFIRVFNEKSQILVKKLQNEQHSFNICPYVALCTLDIICESVMGTTVNAQEDSSSDYVTAVHKLSEILHEHQFSILQLPNWLFSFTPSGRQQTKMLQIVHGFSSKVIQERKAHVKKMRESNVAEDNKKGDDSIYSGRKKRLAFLDLLIEAAEDGAVLTDEEIREEVDTFMFEGHDTTAAGISWSLFLLGTCQDVQEVAVDELNRIFGDSDRPASMEDLQEMKYLERCIKESLRLYASVPFFTRLLKEDAKIEGYTLPIGTAVVCATYSLHRNPEIFPNPEDFNPDNFLPERVQGRHPYAYIPFSAGPRNCIGQKFAILEMKTVISSVLRRYKLVAIDKRADVLPLAELVLRPKNGLKMRFVSRRVSHLPASV